MRRLLITIFILHAVATTYAEETVRSVQEELRRRNIYFGDIDGRSSPELAEAVKRYQHRKGFNATGQNDGDTLRSLGLQARAPGEPPPRELDLPEEPVLKSDVKIDVAREAAEVARESGIAPGAIAPQSESAAFDRRRGRKTTLAREPAAAAGESHFDLRGVPNSPAVDSRKIAAFVADYLRASGRKDLQEELHFYADAVDYFDNGRVDRRVIERILRGYDRRWPSRSYSLASTPAYSFVPSRAEIVVAFHANFSLSGHGKHARGKTENRMVINAATSDPRIVAIEEHRLRR